MQRSIRTKEDSRGKSRLSVLLGALAGTKIKEGFGGETRFSLSSTDCPENFRAIRPYPMARSRTLAGESEEAETRTIFAESLIKRLDQGYDVFDIPVESRRKQKKEIESKQVT